MRTSGKIMAGAGLCAFTALAGIAVAAPLAPVSQAPLGAGTVTVLKGEGLTLHAWSTGDALNDQCFLLETEKGVVAIESPAFKADVALWREYAAGLARPVTDVLLSAHPTGGAWYGAAKSHATAAAKKAIEEGATGALAANLGKAFGEAFDSGIAPLNGDLVPGKNIIGGIEMVILEAGDGYDVIIPAAGAAYTHMLGADTHSILAGPAHMEAALAELAALKESGCGIILSGHHAMETPADIDTKMDYVRRTRDIAAGAGDRAAFIAAMKAAFPGYEGENYLEMTAGMLFPG